MVSLALASKTHGALRIVASVALVTLLMFFCEVTYLYSTQGDLYYHIDRDAILIPTAQLFIGCVVGFAGFLLLCALPAPVAALAFLALLTLIGARAVIEGLAAFHDSGQLLVAAAASIGALQCATGRRWRRAGLLEAPRPPPGL